MEPGLRLISAPHQPLTWMLGAVYATDTIDERRDGRLDDNFLGLGGLLPPPFVNTRTFAQGKRILGGLCASRL